MTDTDALDPGRFVLRPCAPEDLPALRRFAAASAHGITTLPNDAAALESRLERSLQSFATDDTSGEEIYLFVLEDLAAGRIVGTSGIGARAGFSDRFYTYRNEFVVQRSDVLATTNRIHTLHLCHHLTGVTLLTSFYLDADYHDTLAPQLLSRARLLFIAQHADRFSDRIAAESPGLADDSGRCPFWDAVGRRFFDMDYPTVERLAGGRSKSFIAELMPASPIYVPLLPDAAQWAIGQLHPQAELPFSILLDEGFDADTYVDIFDAGPTVQERLGMLKTVARSQLARAAIAEGHAPGRRLHLVANTALQSFRATLALSAAGPGGAALDAEAAQRAAVAPGELVRIAELDATIGEAA